MFCSITVVLQNAKISLCENEQKCNYAHLNRNGKETASDQNYHLYYTAITKMTSNSSQNSLVELDVSWDHRDFPKSYIAWEQIGSRLSRSKTVKKVSIRFDPNPYTRQRRISLWKLAKGLKNNESIETLYFSHVDFTVQGMFFLIMSSFWECNKNFKCLHLSSCRIQNMEMYALARGLMTCSSLTTLIISGTDLSGCRMPYLTFSLRDNLHVLKFDNVNIAKDSLESLVMSILATGVLPTVLNLGNNVSVLEEDWESLRYLFQNQPHPMKQLVLSDNIIGDLGFQLCFGPYVGNKLPLIDLQLQRTGITDDSCIILSQLLRGERCYLTILNIGQNNISDTGAVILSEGLKSNYSLQQLNFGQDNCITSYGWKAFSTLLCNRSSIDATCNSNHALWCLDTVNAYVDVRIKRQLRNVTNANEMTLKTGSMYTAAGYKVLTYHLHDLYSKVKEDSVEWILAPDILGWIGSYNAKMENTTTKCLDAYYHVTKSNPFIFQNHKRRACENMTTCGNMSTHDQLDFVFAFDDDEPTPLPLILDEYIIRESAGSNLMEMSMQNPIESFDFDDDTVI